MGYSRTILTCEISDNPEFRGAKRHTFTDTNTPTAHAALDIDIAAGADSSIDMDGFDGDAGDVDDVLIFNRGDAAVSHVLTTNASTAAELVHTIPAGAFQKLGEMNFAAANTGIVNESSTDEAQVTFIALGDKESA